MDYDSRFGLPTKTKDENGKFTTYHYDPFGRLDQVDYPDGGQTVTTFHDETFPRYIVTTVKEDTAGHAMVKYDYFDGLGRPIKTATLSETGQPVVSATNYDAMGCPVDRAGGGHVIPHSDFWVL